MIKQTSVYLSTSYCPFRWTIAKRINWILTQKTAIVTPDRRIDTPNAQQLSQKHSLANFSDATMNLILCCFASITISDIRNPTMQPTPHTKVSNEYLLIQDFCISGSRKGSRFPKNRYINPLPSTSISTRHSGMYTYAATSGITQLVTTISMHIAVATAKPIRMSGITCYVDKYGMSCPFALSITYTCAQLRCGAPFASTASATTLPSSSTYRKQQNQSVHFLSRLGPSRHCTCSWISLSSSCIIIQNILTHPTHLNLYKLENPNNTTIRQTSIRADDSLWLIMKKCNFQSLSGDSPAFNFLNTHIYWPQYINYNSRLPSTRREAVW